MKKIARVFIVAVFVPSLLLAWLAVRSLRDQQLILERQQFLLYQGLADELAHEADGFVADQQTEFGQQVESLLAATNSQTLTNAFDARLRREWSSADVGFVVTGGCILASPSPASSPAAAAFCTDFETFLINREPAEVYASTTKNAVTFSNSQAQIIAANLVPNSITNFDNQTKNGLLMQRQQQAQNLRVVMPQQAEEGAQNFELQQSKVASSETEFRQLIGDSMDGAVARVVENKLKVLLWHRSLRDPTAVFGAQLSLDRLKQNLRPIVDHLNPTLRDDVAVALLDDSAKPVAISRSGYTTTWRRPFVATELGETLPHWEMAVYLLNPAKLAQSARTLELTLGLLTAVLLLAIGVGGWLIVADLNRQLTLARQKTDFVSNVSHELKTPLTSIRMFSELLAEGRVTEPQKRQSYLNIITSETSRLTRLINNVLDFSRMEHGEKKYQMQPCDLVGLVRDTVETYRPHLESNGFQLACSWPETEILITADRDALAQVIVNLLSNAEKYCNGRKEITLEVERFNLPVPYVEARILDRGAGVPDGCEEKIFEQFYRAHDSLSSGIQGSGLGLTLARQIARAHGGDVLYRPRENSPDTALAHGAPESVDGCAASPSPGGEGVRSTNIPVHGVSGGSCFILRLPVVNAL